MDKKEVTINQLKFSYPTTLFSQKRPLAQLSDTFIGQPKALSALKMGMSIFNKNYHIYLSGDSGSGRHQAIRQVASDLGVCKKTDLHDVLFVYNFSKPQIPQTLVLPAGEGQAFCNLMDNFASFLSEKQEESVNEAIREALTKYKENNQVKNYLLNLKAHLLSINPKCLKANLVCDRSQDSTRPLIFESHPSATSLFGQYSSESEFIHQCLSAGSIIDALDGYLVIDAQELMYEEGLWASLKKFLDFKTIQIKKTNTNSPNYLIRLQPIDLPIKIILVGTDAIYDKYCEEDEAFLDFFNISAEFDFSMPANEQNILLIVGFLDRLVQKNNLLPLTDEAISRLLFFSSWYAEQRNELTTKLSFLNDLLLEANYWAALENHEEIQREDINKAIEQRDFVNSLTETKINQEIQNGEMIISLTGSKVGVINGLAIMDRGNASFGTPTVISVSVAPGSEGIVNIEHEAGLSGEIHDKGLLILEGYLRKNYARSFPLSMYAGICFEQSYAEVDGDSASSAELFALLSAIGDIPLRQEIAVTGSVNQLGDIQPVGGINEKITGFFKICSIMGLTGRQGVIIPEKNLSSLLLPDDILKAVEEGKFHIYAIKSIDEGMQILTNRPAGERNSKGNFPVNTLNNQIETALKRLCNISHTSN